MEFIISIILDSGRTALDMAIYVLMPIMVVMLALMKLLDAKGILSRVANFLAPVSGIFGVPGIGVFAMVKLLFVSFAAPIATLNIMDQNGTTKRHIAATVAMLLVMSQANVVFPLAVVGLNVGVIFATSIIGGLCAAAITYYLVFPKPSIESESEPKTELAVITSHNKSMVQILSEGGGEGIRLVIGMIPLLILALCVVNLLKVVGAIAFISPIVAPLLSLAGLPDAVVLPLVTKFIAGGTAFVGVTLDMMNQGQISIQELNRLAGIAINPFDVVGFTLLMAAGPRVQEIAKPAFIGAIIGVTIRGVMHLAIF